MLNIIKSEFYKHYMVSLKNALIGSLFFLIIHLFANVEFIRKHAEDFSFDVTNVFFNYFNDIKYNVPNVKVFVVDDKYLKAENLLNQYNEATYGYTFPRDKIAQFIQKLDQHIKIINEIPKVLFIDYDMTYATTNYNINLSNEDQQLINVLKQPRDYIIIFPKTNNQNFIENLEDPVIQDLIKNKKIIFSSVGLTISEDDINRRYHPFREFDNQKYINAPITIFNMFYQPLKIENLNNQNVIENRIIFKNYRNIKSNIFFNFYQSEWDNLNKYSANVPLNMIINEDFKDSIIFFGGTFAKDDIFKNNSLIGISDFNGIDIQANALMTLFYLEGTLKNINIILGVIIVFLTFFFVDLFIEVIFGRTNLKFNEYIKFFILLIFSGVILLIISNYILVEHNLWFNWIIPFIVFQVIEFTNIFKNKMYLKLFVIFCLIILLYILFF